MFVPVPNIPFPRPERALSFISKLADLNLGFLYLLISSRSGKDEIREQYLHFAPFVVRLLEQLP